MVPRAEAHVQVQPKLSEAAAARPRAGGAAGAFWAALGEEDLVALEELREREGAKLLALREPKTQKTPLEWAAFLHRHDSMRAMLAWGADPEHSEGGRAKPLAVAVADHCAQCVGMLIEAGAELDAESPDGTTALVRAANLKLAKHSGPMLCALIEAGASPDVLTSRGYFALGAAACNDSPASVAALANAGASLELHAGDGFTALFCAVDNGAALAAEALLRAGADFRAQADCGDGLVDPLGLARERGDSSMAGLLYSFAEAEALRGRIAQIAPGAVREMPKRAARL